MEEKTVLEWLEQAKTDGYEWADKAIYNAHNTLSSERGCDTSIPCIKGEIKGSLKNAINSFWWEKTEEGFEFWNEIYESL